MCPFFQALTSFGSLGILGSVLRSFGFSAWGPRGSGLGRVGVQSSRAPPQSAMQGSHIYIRGIFGCRIQYVKPVRSAQAAEPTEASTPHPEDLKVKPKAHKPKPGPGS